MTTENSLATQPSFLSELHDAQIRADVADALGGGDTISYQGMLNILDDAAVGGMTAGKFSTLEPWLPCSMLLTGLQRRPMCKISAAA